MGTKSNPDPNANLNTDSLFLYYKESLASFIDPLC